MVSGNRIRFIALSVVALKYTAITVTEGTTYQFQAQIASGLCLGVSDNIGFQNVNINFCNNTQQLTKWTMTTKEGEHGARLTIAGGGGRLMHAEGSGLDFLEEVSSGKPASQFLWEVPSLDTIGKIKGVASQRCMDVLNGKKEPRSSVGTWGCGPLSQINQQWKLVAV